MTGSAVGMTTLLTLPPTMARPPNPIDNYRDHVTHLYLNGVSRSRIKYKLRKQYHVAVNLSTISRRIASWGLPRQQARTKETPEPIEAIRDLIFRMPLLDRGHGNSSRGDVEGPLVALLGGQVRC